MIEQLVFKIIESLGLPAALIGDVIEVWQLLFPAIEDEIRREAEIALFIAELRAGQVPTVANKVFAIAANGKTIEEAIKELIKGAPISAL